MPSGTPTSRGDQRAEASTRCVPASRQKPRRGWHIRASTERSVHRPDSRSARSPRPRRRQQPMRDQGLSASRATASDASSAKASISSQKPAPGDVREILSPVRRQRSSPHRRERWRAPAMRQADDKARMRGRHRAGPRSDDRRAEQRPATTIATAHARQRRRRSDDRLARARCGWRGTAQTAKQRPASAMSGNQHAQPSSGSRAADRGAVVSAMAMTQPGRADGARPV